VVQLRPGDVVVGTVNVEMQQPCAPGEIFCGATLSAPGWSLVLYPDGGQRQFTFTATGYGPFEIFMLGGTAYTLFAVSHDPYVVPHTSSLGALTLR
jgi:hypothetical protein